MVSGAGAAAMSCLDLYEQLGVVTEHISVFDSKGHIHAGREDLDERKAHFAGQQAYPDLRTALTGANVFLGLSKGGLLTGEDLKLMADNPVVAAEGSGSGDRGGMEPLVVKPANGKSKGGKAGKKAAAALGPEESEAAASPFKLASAHSQATVVGAGEGACSHCGRIAGGAGLEADAADVRGG